MHLTLLSLCTLALSASVVMPAMAAPTSKNLYWVFLNKGGNKTPLAKEEAQRMQEAHVGNFGKQHERGTVLTAGPLGDDGFIRGIVVFTVKTQQELVDCFQTDPFVQHDYLAVESYPWLADRRKFHEAHVPFKIVQYTLGIVKKGPNWQPLPGEIKANTLQEILPILRKQTRAHTLAVSGPLRDAKDLVGILLYRTTDQAKIRQELDSDLAVSGGRVTVDLHPQWLGEGVFGK